MSETYESLMQGLNEALEHSEGKRKLKTTTLSIKPIHEYHADEIKKIRSELGMTQLFFASFMGVSQKTVEAWESGRNHPNGPACRILTMIEMDPKLPERFNFVNSV